MKAALVISARDNVATALHALQPGQPVDINGSVIVVVEPIARGHKIALRSIAAGEPVIKYGSAIGTASADICAGAHVHTHNVASGRGRGDLDATVESSDARLAEPTDDGAARNGAEPGTAGTRASISSESRS